MDMVAKIINKLQRMFTNTNPDRHDLVGPLNHWQLKRAFQFDFLVAMGLKRSDYFLDIGCGTLRGGIPIIDFLDTGNYTGIDIRKRVLKEAKKELKLHNLSTRNPVILHFKFFEELTFPRKFDVILAFSVLIHMDDTTVAKCFEFVAKNLSQQGVFYANVNINSKEAASWQGFPVMFKEMEFYNELASSFHLTIEDLGTLLSLGHSSGEFDQDNQRMLRIRKAKQ